MKEYIYLCLEDWIGEKDVSLFKMGFFIDCFPSPGMLGVRAVVGLTDRLQWGSEEPGWLGPGGPWYLAEANTDLRVTTGSKGRMVIQFYKMVWCPEIFNCG